MKKLFGTIDSTARIVAVVIVLGIWAIVTGTALLLTGFFSSDGL